MQPELREFNTSRLNTLLSQTKQGTFQVRAKFDFENCADNRPYLSVTFLGGHYYLLVLITALCALTASVEGQLDEIF